MKSLLEALPNSPPGVPSCAYPPLPAAAFSYAPHASHMSSFLSSSHLSCARSGYFKFKQPQITKDNQSRWAAVSRTFLFLQEISAINSLLAKHPEIDAPSKDSIIEHQRRMLLGAVHSLGSLGHQPLMAARQQYLEAMGQSAMSSFSSEPFNLSSPLGPAGHQLWTQGPPEVSRAIASLGEVLRQPSSSRPRGGGARSRPAPFRKDRRSPYQRPRNLPAQPVPQPSAGSADNQSSGRSGNSRRQQQSSRQPSGRGRGKRSF